MSPLTDTEKAMLTFEHDWWKYPGAKDSEVRRRFDMSPVRYAQVLNALLNRGEALAHDPLTVRRLLRLREARRLYRTPK